MYCSVDFFFTIHRCDCQLVLAALKSQARRTAANVAASLMLQSVLSGKDACMQMPADAVTADTVSELLLHEKFFRILHSINSSNCT